MDEERERPEWEISQSLTRRKSVLIAASPPPFSALQEERETEERGEEGKGLC